MDYRKLNNLTLKDSYPLPRIDESLDTLRGAKWFSTLDLQSGYFQVEMDPKDAKKTAFTTICGLYQFKVMSFGLCNAPATFERMMEVILSGLQLETCLLYIDDVIIFQIISNNIWKDYQMFFPDSYIVQSREKLQYNPTRAACSGGGCQAFSSLHLWCAYNSPYRSWCFNVAHEFQNIQGWWQD